MSSATSGSERFGTRSRIRRPVAGAWLVESKLLAVANQRSGSLSIIATALIDTGSKMDEVIWAALPSPPWEEELTDARIDEIAAIAKRLCETTDYAISLSVGCMRVKPWQRATLAREDMQFDPNGQRTALQSHVQFSKEAAMPGTAAGGGGCGCN